MNDLERTYFDAAFASAYPEFVEAERESLNETAGKAMTSPKQTVGPTHPPMTGGDVGNVIADSLAGMAKGVVQQSLGLGGDIRTLVDMVAKETAEKILGARVLPTTEEIKQLLPQLFPEGVQTDPRRRATGAASETVGEFLPVAGPVSAAKRIKFGADGKRVAKAAAPVAATAAGSAEAAEGRFSIKGDQLMDAGVKITPKDLEIYIERQQKAVENNKKQGPMGDIANRLLQKEIAHAESILKQVKAKK